MERIRGGWAKVPDHLKCNTDLSKMGLKPGGQALAEVWNGHIWVQLYGLRDAIPKRKASEKQLEALAKAREIARQNYIQANTCDVCEEFVGAHELRYGPDESKICTWCQLKARANAMQSEGEAWFRRWFETEFVILDTETTGLDGAEIVEIGIIDRHGTTLYESLIKPAEPIPEVASNIHGITDDVIRDAPTWFEKWPEIREILGGCLILIYNAPFDCDMIRNSCTRYGIEPPDLNAECVMEAYRLYMAAERWISLRDASGIWTSHRAVGDCQAVLGVMKGVWSALGLMTEEGMTA